MKTTTPPDKTADLPLDAAMREALWMAISTANPDASALTVTEACAAAWATIRKVIPLEEINDGR